MNDMLSNQSKCVYKIKEKQLFSIYLLSKNSK
jgi:hypothetical protein